MTQTLTRPRTLRCSRWPAGARRSNRGRSPNQPQVDVNSADRKSDFAIGQIIFPHALEAQIEAQGLDVRPRLQEAPAPFGQCSRIARAERFMRHQAQSGARRLAADDVHRRQHAAGEDVALNEVRLPPIVGETVLSDGDDLQHGDAGVGQRLPQLVEVSRPDSARRPPPASRRRRCGRNGRRRRDSPAGADPRTSSKFRRRSRARAKASCSADNVSRSRDSRGARSAVRPAAPIRSRSRGRGAPAWRSRSSTMRSSLASCASSSVCPSRV